MISFLVNLFNNSIFWIIVIGVSFIILSAFKSDPPPKKDPLESINESIQDLAEKISNSIDNINK